MEDAIAAGVAIGAARLKRLVTSPPSPRHPQRRL